MMSTQHKSAGKIVLDMIQLLVGNALSAFAIACFALPYDMVVSGITGVGRMINHYTGFSITAVVYILNIGLFLVGFAVLGKRFAGTILVGSFAFPIFLNIFQNITALHHLVQDPLLAAICAGIIDGVGIGLVIRMGGSTGGIDIPPIIFNRLFGWKIAPVLYAIDVVIFLIQLPVTNTNGVILGILYALIYSVVMNKILVLDQGGIQLMIFSKKSSEINEELLRLGYGTTLIKSIGGYLQEEQDVVYCVAMSRNLNRLKRAILGIDDRAFITISNVNEVNGNGFTTWFNDQEYVSSVKDRHEGV